MTWLIIFIVCFLSLLFPHELQAGEEMCLLTVRGSIRNQPQAPSLAISLTISTKSASYRCEHFMSAEGTLCYAPLSCDTKQALFTISAPGFKRYSRNLAQLKFESASNASGLMKRAFTDIDIGSIELVPSELPKVLQVIRSQASTGSVRFEVILHNQLDREFFVQRLTFNAERERNDVKCGAAGGLANFQVSDRLTIAAKEGEFLKGSSEFQELTRGPGFSVKAEGRISYKGCGGEATLSLAMPTAFTIPAKEYSAIEIRLPGHFNVQFDRSSSSLDFQKSRLAFDFQKSSWQKYPDSLVSNVLDYDRYVFRLMIAETDESEVVGIYSERNSKSSIPPMPSGPR
jgi:hypothetical protein